MRSCVSAPAQVRLTPRIYDGLSFTRGDPINIRVPVVGHPVPRVTWFKDGEELMTELGRRDVRLEDGCAVLNIDECRRATDRGVYGVRVENAHGVDEATFTVEITGTRLLRHRRKTFSPFLLICFSTTINVFYCLLYFAVLLHYVAETDEKLLKTVFGFNV